MPNNVKTYDETGDPEDHVKNFQAVAQVERWVMPTWCHMFNSTLIGAARVWFDELPPESIDGYKDLKAAFLAYFMQQKKFMHGVNNPELTKRLNEHVSKTMEEMMITTTAFIRGEVAATSKKNGHTSWRTQDQLKRHGSERRLLVTIGDVDHSTKAWMNFMIVKSLSPYNGIIGRPEIREIQAVSSTAHRMLKFPVNGGVVTIRSTILIPAECATVVTSSKEIPKEAGVCHENFKISPHPDFPDQEVAIGGTLSAKGRTDLCSLLKKNLDIFAWQPKRGQAPDRAKAIQAEVQKLVEAGIMREVFFTMNGCPIQIVTPFQKSTGKLNLFAVTPLSVSWTLTKVITRYRWQSQMKKKWLSTPAKGFHSKSAEKSLPLFKTLKKCIKKSDFHWTPEVEQAIKQLKQHLLELPLLVAPKPKEELIVCLSASYGAVSAVLMTERGTVQTTVTKVERHAGGTQYHIPAKDVGERTDPGGLPYGSCAGLILTSPEGIEFTYTIRFQFTASNNEAEYKALIAGLRIAAQVPRSKNKKADALSKIASTSFAHLLKHVLVEILKEKSIQEKEVEAIVEEEGPTWMTPIIEYLKDGTIPGDKKEASKLKARQYELLEGVLYRGSFLKPWLRTRKGHVFDSRHGLFHEIDRGNIRGNNHRDNPFKDWCKKLNITQRFASVKHPQSNGLVERANRSLSKGIKARLGEGNKNWTKELPHVLWAHHTMTKSSHGDTLFSLTYGTKAVIPAEIGIPTYRTATVDAIHNDEELRLNLDLVRGVTFRPRDFVYRSNDASHAVTGGKLGPNWEGPYEVTKALGDEAYRLKSMDGEVLPRT
ncbi:reverse transcriptase domain-containing protein [Tanacetum coccineum]